MKKTYLFVISLFLLVAAGEGVATDRWELSKIIDLAPPNGPPEAYGDIVYRQSGKKSEMAPVVFSHALHRIRYTCRVCHLELDFAISRKKSGMSRKLNLKGQYCGACHDGKVAFSLQRTNKADCERCHLEDRNSLKKKFKRTTGGLPSSNLGNLVDWNAAMENEDIEPLDSLGMDQRPMKLPSKLEKPLALGTSAPRSGVLFSHEAHLAWLDCSNCHPDLFEIKKTGTTNFSMGRSLFGLYCGTCHMRVAFPMTDCGRCHPEMKSKSINFGR